MGGERERLIQLAARCEKASGPDRAIDSAIHAALGLGVWTSDEWAEVEAELPPASIPEAARYTASLDASLSLVPEGWRKMVDDLDRTPEAIISTPDQRQSWDGAAATLPLALCAAALRARAEAQP